jgi:hypothetical protein
MLDFLIPLQKYQIFNSITKFKLKVFQDVLTYFLKSIQKVSKKLIFHLMPNHLLLTEPTFISMRHNTGEEGTRNMSVRHSTPFHEHRNFSQLTNKQTLSLAFTHTRTHARMHEHTHTHKYKYTPTHALSKHFLVE